MSAHGFGFQRFDLPDGADIKLQPLQQRALCTAAQHIGLSRLHRRRLDGDLNQLAQEKLSTSGRHRVRQWSGRPFAVRALSLVLIMLI